MSFFSRTPSQWLFVEITFDLVNVWKISCLTHLFPSFKVIIYNCFNWTASPYKHAIIALDTISDFFPSSLLLLLQKIISYIFKSYILLLKKTSRFKLLVCLTKYHLLLPLEFKGLTKLISEI